MMDFWVARKLVPEPPTARKGEGDEVPGGTKIQDIFGFRTVLAPTTLQTSKEHPVVYHALTQGVGG